MWEINLHPDWNFNREHYDADIAIVILEAPTSWSNYIQPVCLPPQQSFNEVTGTGVVTGWGKSENSGRSSHDTIPSKLEVPAINASYCYPTFPQLSQYSSHRMFCGGYENRSKAPCVGDSGGGFYLMGLSESYELIWIVNGIVSGAIYDQKFHCDINKFTLYTNVRRYVDWIWKVVNETMEVTWKNINFDCSNV